MLVRSILGLGGGGAAGAVYGVFGRCTHGQCALDWNPYVPIACGAALGLFVVLSSRWD